MLRRKGIPSYSFPKRSGQAGVRINGKDHDLGPSDSSESKAEYQRLVRRPVADRARSELSGVSSPYRHHSL
jgi:hypothetical protein